MLLVNALAFAMAVALQDVPSVPCGLPDTSAQATTTITSLSGTSDTMLPDTIPSGISSRALLEVEASGTDTIPQQRKRAFEYSDGYEWRNTLHRRLSWAMLPLFAVSYVSGDQLLAKGSDAPSWARSIHRPSATATAALFGVNAVTGTWNLYEGRKDPNGRTRRILHSVLFLGASAGFVYAGSTLAEQAERSETKRIQHRNVNLASMGVSTASWLIMLVH